MSHVTTLPDPLCQLRLQRGAEHLHALGPRAVAEFLTEIAGAIGGLPAIQSLLNEYERRLTSTTIHAAGGGRVPPRPLRVAGRP
jgi:hypothetical protein